MFHCKLDGAAEAAARFSARGAFLGLSLFRCGIHHRWMLFQRRSEAEFKNGGMLMSHSVAFCNSISYLLFMTQMLCKILQETPEISSFQSSYFTTLKTIKLLL